jgi:hypothetical protein
MKQDQGRGAGGAGPRKTSQTERDLPNTIAIDLSMPPYRDRAAIVARAVLQIAASASAPLSAVAAYLRDEFTDVARHTFNEIRRTDE